MESARLQFISARRRRAERPSVGGKKDFHPPPGEAKLTVALERDNKRLPVRGPIQECCLKLTPIAVPRFDVSRKDRKLLQRTPAARGRYRQSYLSPVAVARRR